MLESYEAVFGILKASLWTNEAMECDVPAEIIEELRAQAVDGLAVAVIPNMENAKYLRIARFVQMTSIQNELIDELNAVGIPAVILKGTASGIYYPMPFCAFMEI